MGLMAGRFLRLLMKLVDKLWHGMLHMCVGRTVSLLAFYTVDLAHCAGKLILLACIDGGAHRQVNESRYKGVLGGAIDEWHTLQHARSAVQGRRRYLRLVLLNGRHQVLCSVVQTLHYLKPAEKHMFNEEATSGA